jgi:hypothetical protein
MAKKKKHKHRGTPVGKTTKVGVIRTWVHIFERNEALPKTKKLTDAAITKFMQSEFPRRKSKVFETVNTVRSRYNRGVLTKGEVPKVQSKRYDVGGKQNGSDSKTKTKGQR